MKPMKSFLMLCFLATSSLFYACDELKEVLKADFDFESDAVYIEIDPIEAKDEIQVIGEENYEFDLEQIIEEYASSFSVDNIREVNLTSITIELTDGDENNNIQNFESIYAEVHANGMAEKVVAEKLNIPDTKTMTLTVPIKDGSINLKDFVTKKSFGYKVKAKLRKSTTKTLQAKLTADYNFVVGI